MEQYNSALLEICGERKIECIDLASFLSGDAAVFTDDVHFTEKGAQKVAEILSEHMLRSEPLKKMLLK